MLAAVAWPVQELAHPAIVELIRNSAKLSVTNVLEATGGYTPSLLHGGLDLPQVAPAIAFAMTVAATAEVYDILARGEKGLRFNEFAADSVAGDLGFDPMKLAAELGVTDRYELQEAEMLNARLAMLALIAYTAIEMGGVRVVDFLHL